MLYFNGIVFLFLPQPKSLFHCTVITGVQSFKCHFNTEVILFPGAPYSLSDDIALKRLKLPLKTKTLELPPVRDILRVTLPQ